MKPQKEIAAAATAGSSYAIPAAKVRLFKAYTLRHRDLMRDRLVATAGPIPKPDSILAAIKRVEVARQTLCETVDDQDQAAAERAYHQARDELLRSSPTTPAGMQALLRHFIQHAECCPYELNEVLPMLMRATKMSGKS